MGRFKFEDDYRYMMPAHFGGMKHVTSTTIYRDVTSLVIQYRTERDAIEPYVPEALEITDPTPDRRVRHESRRGVDRRRRLQPGGRERTAALRRQSRSRRVGGFSLVVWENKVTPILPGREATGIPKIRATIDEARHLFGRWNAEAAYEGNTFLEMSLAEGDELPAQLIEDWNRVNQESHWLGWRYIPNVSGPGAALNHPTTYPQGSVIRSARLCTGAIQWKPLTCPLV